MEKALTVAPLDALTPEAAAAFAAVHAQFDTSGGLVTLAEWLHNAQVCEVTEDGRAVAWFALRGFRHAHTEEAELIAAAGRASVDLTKTVLPYIESQVTPADALTIYTRRRGLVRKLERQGYRLDGYVMRKTLQVIQ